MRRGKDKNKLSNVSGTQNVQHCGNRERKELDEGSFSCHSKVIGLPSTGSGGGVASYLKPVIKVKIVPFIALLQVLIK